MPSSTNEMSLDVSPGVMVVFVTRLNPVDGVRDAQGTGLLSSLAGRRFRLIHDPLPVLLATSRELPVEEFNI